MRALLSKGADINVQNIEGQTSLMLACKGMQIKDGFGKSHERLSPEGVRMLLEAGAKTDIKDKKGNSALRYAGARSSASHKAIVKVLEGRDVPLLCSRIIDRFEESCSIEARRLDQRMRSDFAERRQQEPPNFLPAAGIDSNLHRPVILECEIDRKAIAQLDKRLGTLRGTVDYSGGGQRTAPEIAERARAWCVECLDQQGKKSHVMFLSHPWGLIAGIGMFPAPTTCPCKAE
jgi:ankyrin repeat protein